MYYRTYSDKFNDLGVPVNTVGAVRSNRFAIMYYKLKNPKDWTKLDRAKKKICKAFNGSEYLGEMKNGAEFALMFPLPAEFWTFYKYESYGGNFEKTAKSGDFQLGMTLDGKELNANIYNTRSILIAGSSGGGKSSLMNCIIDSIIRSSDNIIIDCIDLKRVELGFYNYIHNTKHYVATTKREAADLLRSVKDEIDRRYKIMSEKKILKASPEDFPPYVIFIDEFAALDAPAGSTIHSLVSYITAVGRACGVFMVIATQHPKNSVIDNTIRANCSTKILLACSNSAQSTTICGSKIGVDLLGKGDTFLFLDGELHPIRFQAPLYDEETRNKLYYIIKK